MNTTRNVSVTDWGSRGYRVRVWQAPPQGKDFGHILVEEFKRSRTVAEKLAAKWAKEYQAEVI